jgi:hypothetical protein
MKATESRALASKFKEAVKHAGRCSFEIRSPIGNAIGQRLQKALEIAGVKTELIEVVATPNAGILIETSQECGGLGLSIQTAFKAIGMEAHLLIQNTGQTNLVIIHLNSSEAKGAPK